jgi:hypothetical protein
MAVAAVLLTGCGGGVYTMKADPQQRSWPGVLVYQPRLMRATYEYTKLKDDAGRIVGSAGRECAAVRYDDVEVHPDYTTPYVLGYAPGLVGKQTFSLTLADGMVASVNAESDPQIVELLGALTTAVEKAAPVFLPPAAAGTIMSAPSGGAPACNAAPRLQELVPLPEAS